MIYILVTLCICAASWFLIGQAWPSLPLYMRIAVTILVTALWPLVLACFVIFVGVMLLSGRRKVS
jgi:hypothetical protein